MHQARLPKEAMSPESGLWWGANQVTAWYVVSRDPASIDTDDARRPPECGPDPKAAFDNRMWHQGSNAGEETEIAESTPIRTALLVSYEANWLLSHAISASASGRDRAPWHR